MQTKEINNRILVVDDNRDILVNFTKILSPPRANNGLDALLQDVLGKEPSGITPWSFDVDTATSGKEALETIKQSIDSKRLYSVVFMDVRMPPGMDGIETVQRIWEVDPDVQAVICTAYSDYSWQEMAQKLTRISQWLILKKPFSSIEVLQCAHALAMKWHLAQLQKKSIDTFDHEMNTHFSALKDAEESIKSGQDWRNDLQTAIKDTQRSIEQMRDTFEKIKNESSQYSPLSES